MTDLISRISKTIYAVRSNEKLGSLFAELCTMLDPNATTKLLEYHDHRFMGLTIVIRRILEKYEELEIWFAERIEKALRERKTPPEDFPLVEERQTLLQMYALLEPITVINTHSQSESANQPEFLGLLRTVLDETQQLLDCFRKRSPRIYFQLHELTPLAKRTRSLLAKSFYANFLKRYTDSERITTSAFVPEMQMMLHLLFKNPEGHLNKIVKLCCSQHVVDQENVHLRMTSEQINDLVVHAEEADRAQQPDPHSSDQRETGQEVLDDADSGENILNDMSYLIINLTKLDTEDFTKNKWLSDRSSLLKVPRGKTETLLEFWKRQSLRPRYEILPIVACILFAIPASAAQIERDFGVNGMMVPSHRSSLAKHNIDMCSFINRNRDITKRPRMSSSEVAGALPGSAFVRVGTEETSAGNVHDLLFGEN
ncbi:LOW QUALITY PROTEIN: Hypothetical protein PHPALM_1035 [Phytophthora palmivora]|uniref:HAT C-terminal dimerisation domain-containing protein n=1 Tax=Phytophthora palmivora TaxID=4796 RepID=A0A2P4YTB2_9STRA|nr:LOW QUALITY PROTEIN: Hypothetical protein PHPALM_1035 [Phytophthora palmivora]